MANSSSQDNNNNARFSIVGFARSLPSRVGMRTRSVGSRVESVAIAVEGNESNNGT